MDLSKQFQCLVEQKQSLFGEYTYYQRNINQEEKFACTGFIAPSFDFIMFTL